LVMQPATNSRIDLEMSLRQRIPVLVHQFTIDRNGITHTPTGWRRDSSGTITREQTAILISTKSPRWAAGFG
jgi:hypothetical protein